MNEKGKSPADSRYPEYFRNQKKIPIITSVPNNFEVDHTLTAAKKTQVKLLI